MTGENQPERVLDDAGAHPGAPIDTDAMLAALDDARACVVRDLEGAFATLDRLAPAVIASGDDRVASRHAAVRAHALSYASRYTEAVESGSEAVRLAESAGDTIEYARARMVLVHAQAKLGNLRGALESALAAERAFTDADRFDLAAQALTNAAIVTRMTGDTGRAIAMFQRALEIHDHEPTTRAQIESGLAETLLDAGRFAEAEPVFKRSAETFEAAGVTRAAAIVRGSLADMYGRQGRLASAIEQFEIARRFFEADEATGELGRILTEQADVYAATGLTEDAIAGYQRAGELLASAGAVQERARALTGVGRLQIRHDPESAERALLESQALYENAGNTIGRAVATLHLASLRLDRGDHAKVEPDLAAAAAALADHRGESLLCDLLTADLKAGLDESDQAEAILTGAMERAREFVFPMLEAETLHRRAMLRADAGRLLEAIDDARAAIESIERTRGSLQGSHFRAGLMGGNQAMYSLAVRLMLENGAIQDAFEYTELARGRTLLDLVEGGAERASAADSDDPATDKLLREYAQVRADLHAAYSNHDPIAGGTSPDSWKDSLRDAEHKVSEIEIRLHATRRGRQMLGTPERLDGIAGCLSPNQALVSYWIDGDKVIAFVIRAGLLSLVRLRSIDEIEDAIHAVQFQIRRGLVRGGALAGNAAPGTRRVDACKRALESLHALIWAPLTDALSGTEQVVVVPAGTMHTVPFGALFDGEAYLVELTEPIVLPTASMLPLMADGKQAPPSSISVLAVPDRIAPEIEKEANLLRDALTDASVTIGPEATAQRARNAAASSGILHLACHGAFPSNNPLAAGLKLADSWVTVRDVLGWTLPGSVVVLSGCDTGRNALDSGEELYGFGRGFLAAGARGLVMSLWSAHDATTRGLMSEMYRTLAPSGAGETNPIKIRSALVCAQRSQIRAGIHPALWANFVYLGV